ncbi:hypothetical protein GCM10009745_81880 [Kribbella yunnanensis]|uniref:Uncharacterized protein n=1 Tax=Kribbella yunnanensis TaxID=190194 RepID=A0ABN2J949_9ACTN
MGVTGAAAGAAAEAGVTSAAAGAATAEPSRSRRLSRPPNPLARAVGGTRVGSEGWAGDGGMGGLLGAEVSWGGT